MSKRVFIMVVGVAFCVGGFALWPRHRPGIVAPQAVTMMPTPAPLVAPSIAPVAVVVPAVPGTSQSAAAELEKTRRSIVDYHTLMGQNPVGTNAEIMRALMGANPHQAVLGPAEGQQLNDTGELVDPWGTPYFFHQLSGDLMEIHSAGPDKIMGTDDDLVIK